MGRATERIEAKHRAFIERQRMFFVATAPRDDAGLINVSPKGIDGSFAVLDETTVAYLDLVGSGIETVAHLRENGRICVMFCAFDGSPNILRLQGRGEAVFPGDERYDDLRGRFADVAGERSIIVVHVRRVSDTCGFGVPLYDYVGQRPTLVDWAEKQGPENLAVYQRTKNAKSLDGLPGVPT